MTTAGDGIAPRLGSKEYLDPYARVYSPARFVWGGRAYALHPAPWLRALRKRAFGPPPSPGRQKLWRLPEMDDRTARDMATQAARRRARIVFANYFNASKVFEFLPADVGKAIIVHDVMALRRDTMHAVGVPLDFDEAMVARELAAFRRADACIAIKPEEADYIRAVAPETTVVTIPFTMAPVDVDLDDPREPVALFVGSDNFPNRDALVWLLTEIWPEVHRQHPEARLRVVGQVARGYAPPWPAGATTIGVVDDLQTEYRRACVALIPLRVGSGLKVKMIEALASGLPCVATSVGAEGLPTPPAEALTVVDEPRAFAAALGRAVARGADATARYRARDYVRDHFSDEVVLSRLRLVLDHL